MVDIDRGIFINRVVLILIVFFVLVVLFVIGLLVYNIVNVSSGSIEVLLGFYYWDGIWWIVMGGIGGKDWLFEGNVGINVVNNFLGIIDNIFLVFRMDDSERMFIDVVGIIGIGNNFYIDMVLCVNNVL